MKILKHSIWFISLIAVMFCCTAMADDKVSFSGGKMIFPEQDSIPDANVAGLTFNLDKVPPDLKFMTGKVYRAESKSARFQSVRVKQYLLLYDWKEETMKFLLASGGTGGRVKAVVYTLTCPSKPSQEFDCTNKAGKNLYKFSVQGGKPVLDATSGGNYIFEEVALIPADILKPAGK